MAYYFYTHNQKTNAFLALSWPVLMILVPSIPPLNLLALVVLPTAPVLPVQRRFMAALGYKMIDQPAPAAEEATAGSAETPAHSSTRPAGGWLNSPLGLAVAQVGSMVLAGAWLYALFNGRWMVVLLLSPALILWCSLGRFYEADSHRLP